MQTTADSPIIVGADGSRSGLAAVEAAARQAETHGRPLHIIHAFNWAPTMPPDGLPRTSELADTVINEAVRVATGAAPSVTVRVRTMEGPATTNLLRAARNAALLVIRGGGLDASTCLRADCGVLQLAARAACSVLITHDDPVDDAPIVVGVDRSVAATGVLDFAFATAAATHSRLIVVQVVESPTGPNGDPHDPFDLVDQVDRRMWAYAVGAEVRTRSGDPAEVLRTESTSAGLLIVGPRGDRLGRGLLGPVTQTLLHHSTAPMIIARGLPVGQAVRVPKARPAGAGRRPVRPALPSWTGTARG